MRTIQKTSIQSALMDSLIINREPVLLKLALNSVGTVSLFFVSNIFNWERGDPGGGVGGYHGYRGQF